MRMDAIKAAKKTWRKYSRYHQERRDRAYQIGIAIELWIGWILICGMVAEVIRWLTT